MWPSLRTTNRCTLLEIPLNKLEVAAVELDSKRAAVPFGELIRATRPNVLPVVEVALAKIAMPALDAFWPSIAVEVPVADNANPARALPEALFVTPRTPSA